MTRAQMVATIRERLKDEYDLELSKEEVNAVMAIEEDEIYQVIALCDNFKYIWGLIYGTERAPHKIGGTFSMIAAVRERHGWSNYKVGVPKVCWSQAAKVCENHAPGEYFEQPEHKYTTAAYLFRKDYELPELPEYEGLSEEEILELCKKADKQELSRLRKGQRRIKERSIKHNLTKKKGTVQYWKSIGYTPISAVYDPYMGEYNYTGKQVDVVDYFVLKRTEKHKDELNAAQLYDIWLGAKDLATSEELLDEHPEIEENLNNYKQLMKEQGLQELEHAVVALSPRDFKVTYNGEVNPWDIDPNVQVKTDETKVAEIKAINAEYIEKLEELKAANKERRKRKQEVE